MSQFPQVFVLILLIVVGTYIATAVQAQFIEPDYDALLSPVCSLCDCRGIPLANATIAANAPVVNVESEGWKQHRVQNVTNSPFGLFFRSSDVLCRVEIKLAVFSARNGWGGGLLVLPFGKQNLTVVQRTLSDSGVCRPYNQRFIRLGKSALSIGYELGVQVILPNELVSPFEVGLNYRKWCGSALPVALKGFELPPVSTNGSAQTVNLTGVLSNQSEWPSVDWRNMTWEAEAPSKCALEVTFHRAPTHTILNQTVQVVPWMVYRLPTGASALIDVMFAHLQSDTTLEVSYEAVNCNNDSRSNHIEIISWNDSVILLEYSTGWRTVTRTFLNSYTAPRQLDLAVMIATTPTWPGGTMPFIFETDKSFNVWDSNTWPSQFYQTEFYRVFGMHLLQGADPIVRFLQNLYAGPPKEEIIRYRAVLRSQVIYVAPSMVCMRSAGREKEKHMKKRKCLERHNEKGMTKKKCERRQKGNGHIQEEKAKDEMKTVP